MQTDSIGSVAFHPIHPLLLTVSGSRHFDDQALSSESEDSCSDCEGEGQHTQNVKSPRKPQPVTKDSSLKIWSFGSGIVDGADGLLDESKG